MRTVNKVAAYHTSGAIGDDCSKNVDFQHTNKQGKPTMSAERKVFGRLQGMAETPPDLIEIQTKSYDDFLQADVPPAKRVDKGLQAIFKEIFPVQSYDGRYSLDFIGYTLGRLLRVYEVDDRVVPRLGEVERDCAADAAT